MICALLAVLELVRLHAIVLTQAEIFGPIFIRKHKMFDVVFAGGATPVIADEPPESSQAQEEQRDQQNR
jgi:chromatin segregation and condensation protein Rec8/ScpA/Scc1 (kleisin family)